MRLVALLDNERRRRAVASLLDRGGPIGLEDLVQRLLPDGDTEAPTAERLTVELHHVHLPKLAAVGLVEYDADEGVVRDGEAIERARPYLDPECEFSAGA